MSLDSIQQLRKFLDNSKEILILIPPNPSADAIGSAFALYFFLEKNGQNPALTLSENIPSKFNFLPCPKKILSKISGARDFVLSFDTARNKIKEIRHEETSSKFNIFLTPEHGSIDPRDFSFILAKFKYDLVIIIGSPDLENLGQTYLDNTDLFFEVPIVNIDHRSENENFGQINLVDVTASSCCEIITEIILQINPDIFEKDIATCLLTGIIGETDSFQKKNTTPKTLLGASSLMERGADQQEIVRWLYKTHSLPLLKLLGRIMSKLNWEEKSGLVWANATLEDFVQSRGSASDLPIILDELQENYSDGKIFALFWGDTPEGSIALIRPASPEMLKKISATFEVKEKAGNIELRINKKMELAQNEIVEVLKNI